MLYQPQLLSLINNMATDTLTPATIVTSTASKQNYANNVDSLNKANDTIRRVNAGETASGIAASLGMSPEDFVKLNPSFAATGGPGDYKGLTGMIKVGQTYNTSTPIDGVRNNNTGGDGAKNGSTGTSTTDTGDTTIKNLKVSKTTTNTDGSSTNFYEDGSGMIDYGDGMTYKIPKGMDPTLAKLQGDNIRQLQKNADTVNATMNKLANYSVDTDPAAVAAANRIKADYQILIQQMKDKNSILAGSQSKNSARSGMLQYANEMDSNFKSMELDKANMRVADLIQKEQDAIAKSNEAYRSGNVKALEASQKEYNKILEEKSKTVNDFAKMVNDQVKLNYDEIKLAQTEKTTALTNDIKISTASALELANTIKDSGITDQTQIDSYIDAMADKLGITDPVILRSAVDKAVQSNTTFDLKTANSVATLNKKKSTKTSSTSSLKTVTDNINNRLGSIRGEDNYVDPYEYIAMYKQWVTKYSDKDFKAKFPAENYINPGSYKLLPPQLKPKL
jgi:hypothetical protein